MVAAAAMVAVEAKVGKAAWEAMTEEERGELEASRLFDELG